MIDQFPSDLQKTIQAIFASERQLSYGEAAEYNAFVSDADYATSISASGRVFLGSEAVKDASFTVASRNAGERNRTFEWIAAEFEEHMAYIVFRASLENKDATTGEFHKLAWIVSMVFREIDGVWKIAHRQNTRWNTDC